MALRLCSRLVTLVLLALGLAAEAQAGAAVILDLPLGEQVDRGLGPVILSADEFGRDGNVRFARKRLLPDNGAGGWYAGPTVDLLKFSGAPMDLSAPGTVLRFTARYFQGGANTNPYSDAPIWITARDEQGRRSRLGAQYGSRPALTHPAWMTCLGEIHADGKDPDFDLTRVVSLEFGGTDWAGKGDDYVDISHLQIVAPDAEPVPPMSDALAQPDGAEVCITGLARPSESPGYLFRCEDLLHCLSLEVRDPVAPEALKGAQTGRPAIARGTLQTDPVSGRRYLQAVVWCYAPEPARLDPEVLQVTCQVLTTHAGAAAFLGRTVQLTGVLVGGLPSQRSVLLSDDQPGAQTSIIRVDMGQLPSWRQPATYHGDRIAVTGLCCTETLPDGTSRPVVRVQDRPDIVHHWPAGEEPATVRVAVVIFDPVCPGHGGKTVREEMGWYDPHQATREYIRSLAEASNGWCRYEVVSITDAPYFPDMVDGYRHDPDAYVDGWRGQDRSSLHSADTDVVRVLTDKTYPHNQPLSLVERVASGDIDEVFLFGAPVALGLSEAAMAGPDPFFINGATYAIPEARRNFAIMGFNYERELGCMLEDFCHRTECTLSRIYQPADWWFPTVPLSNDWDRFRAFEQRTPGEAANGICHYSPNSLSDYEWGSGTVVQSMCDDWLYNWPALRGAETARPVDCREWGDGDMERHHVWWLNHLPKGLGTSPDGKQRNWWKYVLLKAQ